jgi:hypothetical protein
MVETRKDLALNRRYEAAKNALKRQKLPNAHSLEMVE